MTTGGEKGTVVVADFDNATGDSEFDVTLKRSLAVRLESSYLHVLSDGGTRSILQMMERPANDRITRDLAREICLRNGGQAIVLGSIAKIGTQYLIGLEAASCSENSPLVKEEGDAASKADVLNTFGNTADTFRRRLEASLPSIKRPARLYEVTTPSLEAVKAYSLGVDAYTAKGPMSAVPYYKQARSFAGIMSKYLRLHLSESRAT